MPFSVVSPLFLLISMTFVVCHGQMTAFHPFISAVPHPSLVPVAIQQPLVTQYHAQDEFGQASFGYAHPGQAASNFRDAWGNQIGSWAYIDPQGNHVRVSYVADANGFRVLSNALPVTQESSVSPVTDTPEVAQAKRDHFAAVAEVRARNAAIKSRQRRSPHHNGRYYSSYPKSKGQQYYRPKSTTYYHRRKDSRPVPAAQPPVVHHVIKSPSVNVEPAPIVHVPAPIVHRVEPNIVHVPVVHTLQALPHIQEVPLVHVPAPVHTVQALPQTVPVVHELPSIVHDVPVVHSLPVEHQPLVPAVQVAAAMPSVTISKYHSQDELGQASFGHVTPDQSASNFRDINGNQIGHYAYINPDGRQIVVYYTAGVGGFRVVSNALPEAPDAVTLFQQSAVEETAEVAEARRAHMALVEEARNRIKPSSP